MFGTALPPLGQLAAAGRIERSLVHFHEPGGGFGQDGLIDAIDRSGRASHSAARQWRRASTMWRLTVLSEMPSNPAMLA